MNRRSRRGPIPRILALCLWLGATGLARAQTAAPAPASPPAPASSATPAPAPATPKTAVQPAPATPVPKPPAPSATPVPVAPAPPAPGAPAKPLAPGGAPQTHEVEPGASPQTPGTATLETIDVPARPIVFVKGQSSYDDAFKSIKASQAIVKAAMDKAGLKASGHPITIFTDTDDKGFSYESAIPVAAGSDKDKSGKPLDLGGGVAFGQSPAGSGLKFQHRGPFDEIDSTYDLIVSYLDEKGLQIEPPYIEEYLADLTTPDDPDLAVDIYVFVKK